MKKTRFKNNVPKRFLGAIPVGLKGKFYGIPYNVLAQYDLTGKVSIMVYDSRNGDLMVQITGKQKTHDAELLTTYIYNQQENADSKLLVQIKRDAKLFVGQLSDEVNLYNKTTLSKAESKPKQSRTKAEPKPAHKRGSVTKYIDSRGKENKTYKVIRSSSGSFKRFDRVAGAECNHKKCARCGGVTVKNRFLGSVSDVCSPKCLNATRDMCECKCGGEFHKGRNFNEFKKRARL